MAHSCCRWLFVDRGLCCSAGVARRDTYGTLAPVDDLGFIDLVARVVGGRQARGVADRAVDVDHPAAGSADAEAAVVTHPILLACRLARGLVTADEATFG